MPVSIASRSSPRRRSPTSASAHLADLTRVPLLLIDALAMRKLLHTAPEHPLPPIMRTYEPASPLLTSNPPVEDCDKLLGDTAAVPTWAAASWITRTYSVRAAEPAHQGPDDLTNTGSREQRSTPRLQTPKSVDLRCQQTTRFELSTADRRASSQFQTNVSVLCQKLRAPSYTP